MSREDFPHAVTFMLILVSLLFICLGKSDIAIYHLLCGILLQMVVGNTKDDR